MSKLGTARIGVVALASVTILAAGLPPTFADATPSRSHRDAALTSRPHGRTEFKAGYTAPTRSGDLAGRAPS